MNISNEFSPDAGLKDENSELSNSQMLRLLLRNTDQILERMTMTDQALDDLTAGDAAETSAINDLLTAYKNDAAANTANDPAIEAIAKNMAARAVLIESTLNPSADTTVSGSGSDSISGAADSDTVSGAAA